MPCSASGGECGAGGWTGPKPGDPNLSDIALRASNTNGGIDVTWSYPVINPHAVAYTTLYKSRTDNYASAVQLARVSGSSYYDKTMEAGMHYYWAIMTSVNGTNGEVVGSASANRTPETDAIRPIGVDDIDDFFGDAIDRIVINYDDLQQEIRDRIRYTDALADAMALMEGQIGTSMTLMQTDVSRLTEGQNSIIERQDTLAALNAENLAAITAIDLARVTDNEALASSIQMVLAETQNNAAAIISEREARTTEDSALASQIDSVNALTEAAAAAVVTETNARVTADQSLASQITNLNVAHGQNLAAIQAEQIARANADSVLASNINTVQTEMNGQIASVQQTMSSEINSVTNKLKTIYGIKLQANGLFGGFALVNDGIEVSAAIDADKFTLGRPGANGVRPFELRNGVIYITNAVIQNLSLGKGKLSSESSTIMRVTQGSSNHVVTKTSIADSEIISATIGGFDSSSSGVLILLNFEGTISNYGGGAFYYRLSNSTFGTYIDTTEVLAFEDETRKFNVTHSFYQPINSSGNFTFRLYGWRSSSVSVTLHSPKIVLLGALR